MGLKKGSNTIIRSLLVCILTFLFLVGQLLLPSPDTAVAAAGSIYGTITDYGTGEGISYPDVDLYDMDGQYVNYGETDAYGNYSISNVAPGDYKLYFADRMSYDGKVRNEEWYKDKFSIDKADTVHVNSGQAVRIDVVLSGLCSISGRVTSAQESGGVKNVYVYAYDPWYRLKGRGITDTEGRYTIEGLYACEYKIKFDTQRAERPYIDVWYKSEGRFEDASMVATEWEKDKGGVDVCLERAASKDNRIKAVVMSGSGMGGTLEREDSWIAQYFESRNIRVERLYSEADPRFALNPEWDILHDIFEGAKIITYIGHGIYYGELPDCRVGGFYAMGNFFGYPELSTVDFAENPVVAFAHACFSAGGHSAGVDTTDEEETDFIAMYANDFMGWQRGNYRDENSWRIDYEQPNLGFALYYANNSGFSSFFEKLLSNYDYPLYDLIDEAQSEDPYRYNNESDPANPMKEDYRMLLPQYIGSVALVGNMNLTTKDIIPPIPPPGPPYGYDNLFYFAEGYTGSGFQEYLTLGNSQSNDASVQVLYLFADGNFQAEEMTVPAGSRATVDVNTAVGWGKDVSIRIASNQPLVAERPMYFNYNGLTGGHDVMGNPSPPLPGTSRRATQGPASTSTYAS